jgi:UDP-N-acetylglucosamine acyltransferase
MNSLLFADLPPFVMCQGQPAQARSMNFEGLKRRGFTPSQIQSVKAMHKLLYRDGLTLEQAAQQIQGLGEGQDDLQPVVSLMTAFLQDVSPQRGIVR